MEELLAKALLRLLERYISLANLVNSSTTAVRWQPETDVEVLDAKKVLDLYNRRKGNG